MAVKKMHRFSFYFRIWIDEEDRYEYQRIEVISENDSLSNEDISEITENELDDFDCYGFDGYFYFVK